MLKYIIKRLLMMVWVLIGISVIIFTIMNLTPGSAAQLILGQSATPQQILRLNAELGLDRPIIVRYFSYMLGILRGDFGVSYLSRAPVFTEILARFPATLMLASASMFIATIVGVPIGVISAVRQYSFVDAASLVMALLFASIPGFVMGLTMILIFSRYLHLFPSIYDDTWQSFVLPGITLATGTMATLLRMTRSTMLEVIRQDYIRTARAKGADEKRIVLRHALRNALLPIITVIGVDFGFLLGGTLVIESVFSMPGIGTLMVHSIRMKDTPVVMGAILFVTLAYSLVNLLVDVVYAYIDPRIKSQFAKG